MADIDDTGAADYTSDIHVHFLCRGITRIYGTWRQLQNEGFIPASEPMPTGTTARWRANDCADVTVDRKWVPGSRKRGVKLLESDWWRLSIDHDYWTLDRQRVYPILAARAAQLEESLAGTHERMKAMEPEMRWRMATNNWHDDYPR